MHFLKSFSAFLKAGFVCTILFLAVSGVSFAAAATLAVVVVGLEGEARKNVELALSPPGGILDRDQVDELLLALFQKEVPPKVRVALEPFGYYHPLVETAIERSPDKVVLQVNVEPGPPVRVKAIRIDLRGPGSEMDKLRENIPLFPLKEGDVLRQDLYEEGKNAIQDAARESGYLDADFSTHVILLSLKENSAQINLILDTGPRYYFGEVVFVPPLTFPESFLRRYLAFRPGRPYSPRSLARTQLNFNNADRFSEITIEADKEEARDYRVPVRLHLTPSKLKRFRFGIGYETDNGLGMLARYQDLNFNHWGHEASAELRLSERLQGVGFDYILPGTRHLDNKTAFKLGYKHEITDTYDTRSLFAVGEYVQRIGRGRLGSATLQLLREDYTIGDQKGIATLLIPGARFWQRRYDDPVRPTRGYRFSIETRGSTPALGSDGSFLQVIPQGDAMIPLGNGFSLLLRGQMGASLQNEPLKTLPPSLRFFAGGDQSVRGYAYQSLGPKDPSGKVVGGKNLLVGSLEIEKAITSLWGVAAFYDAGNAFDDFSQYELKQGAGLGLRIYTPMGPIRLDLARQIGVSDNQYRIHLSVGFAL
jgi:translocation and assembly module TamA